MITILSVIAFYIAILAISKIDELIREKCPKLGIHCNSHFYKVGCVFQMVIRSEFRKGQYKDDDHRDDSGRHTPLYKKSMYLICEFQIKLCCVPKKRKRKRKVKRKLRLEINRNSLKQLKDFHIATIYNYEIATITR